MRRCAAAAAPAPPASATTTTVRWPPWASRARWWKSGHCASAASSPGWHGSPCTSRCWSASATAWRCWSRGSTVTCSCGAGRVSSPAASLRQCCRARRRALLNDLPDGDPGTPAAPGPGVVQGGAGSDHAARLLRRVPLQPPRAGTGVEHQPAAHPGTGGLHARRGHSAGRGRLRRLPDRGCRGECHPQRRRRGTRAAAGAARGPAGGGDLGGAARHFLLPVVAAGAARAACQRDDPREGPHARPAALRGLGVLRQAHARAPRGLDAPLSLVMRTFFLVQNGISLVSFGALLAHFSPWAVVVLLLAGLPAFVAEAKFSGDAFRLFRWRSPETRMQIYLETVLAREDHVKEVKLFGLGTRLLERYQAIFRRLYQEDRALTIRRDLWGFFLSLIGSGALYGAYAWIAISTVRQLISIGQMTMYVALFRQGQTTVSAMLTAVGGMYEDNLYLSTLYEYLETEVILPTGSSVRGPHPEA